MGGKIIRISEAKGSQRKPQNKKLRIQINGKFNDISSAAENTYKYHCRAFI
jgi:hypothetical protein